MASSWGSSWGTSWGGSWGASDDVVVRVDRTDAPPARHRPRLIYIYGPTPTVTTAPPAKSAPLKKRKITPTVLAQAWSDLIPGAGVVPPVVAALVPDVVMIPRGEAVSPDQLSAALSVWLGKQAEVAAMLEDEEDIEMLLLSA